MRTMWLEGFLDVELLGQGGAGDVYRARRASTGAPVAIKFLRATSTDDLTIERELQALVGLQGHPNVVHVEEVIRLEEHFGLVMEYAPGGSLIELMQARGGHLSIPESILVGSQTASALADAHARGFVHRDIKPHNLLIGKFGQIKVCDFGIAAIAARDGLETAPDSLTPRYASPEQLRDDPNVTARTDVYSLGATLHHVLTGRYVATTVGDADGVLAWWQPEPDVDPSVAEGVRRVIRWAVAADPSERPDAAQLTDEFDHLAFALGGARARRLEPERDTTVVRGAAVASPMSHARLIGSTDRSGPVTPTTGQRARRAPSWLWFAALLAVAVIGAGVILALTSGDGGQPVAADPRDTNPSSGTEATSPTTVPAATEEAAAGARASVNEVAATTTTTTTTTTSTTTTTTTTTLPPDPEAVAAGQVDSWLQDDRTTLDTLRGSFVPQLSAKVYGLRTDPVTEARVDEGGVLWDWQAIVAQHQEFRDRFGAILVFYSDLGEGEQDLVDWVFTVVPIRHADSAAVRDWCAANGLDYPTQCISQEVPA